MKTKTLIPMLSLALGLSLTHGQAQSWSLTGNAGTTDTHFLGTTDGQVLELRAKGVGINTKDLGNFKFRVEGGTLLGARMAIGRSGVHYDEIGYNLGFTGTNDAYTYLSADTAASVRLGAMGGGIELRTAPDGAANSPLSLTTRMVVTQDGKVGIGTTSPQARLDVAGQIRSTTLLLTSDRNAKTNFLPVACRDVLEKVARLPISTWHYTNAPGVRHSGPMAQDFKAAFGLGEDDKHIATVDADGVALASIQALYEMVQEKDSEIAALQCQVSALKTELAGVKNSVADRLAALEKAMSKNILQASFRPEAAR